MDIAIRIGIVVSVFLLMEGVAWFAHKYIMHGFGWKWHADHHNMHQGFFEKNDYYALVFTPIAIFCIVFGDLNDEFWYLFHIGLGITAYGLFYFIFHDLIVHRRVKFKFTTNSKYMKRIMHAHYVHHKTHTKEGAEAFGFLYAPKKYERKS